MSTARGIQPAGSRRVRPARSTPVSSMLSAPSTIAYSSAITFAARVGPPPAGLAAAAPDAPPAPQITSRWASVATSITPASATTHSSSKRTRTPSVPTGLVILHHGGDLLTQDAIAQSIAFPCSGRHSSFPT